MIKMEKKKKPKPIKETKLIWNGHRWIRVERPKKK